MDTLTAFAADAGVEPRLLLLGIVRLVAESATARALTAVALEFFNETAGAGLPNGRLELAANSSAVVALSMSSGALDEPQTGMAISQANDDPSVTGIAANLFASAAAGHFEGSFIKVALEGYSPADVPIQEQRLMVGEEVALAVPYTVVGARLRFTNTLPVAVIVNLDAYAHPGGTIEAAEGRRSLLAEQGVPLARHARLQGIVKREGVGQAVASGLKHLARVHAAAADGAPLEPAAVVEQVAREAGRIAESPVARVVADEVRDMFKPKARPGKRRKARARGHQEETGMVQGDPETLFRNQLAAGYSTLGAHQKVRDVFGLKWSKPFTAGGVGVDTRDSSGDWIQA